MKTNYFAASDVFALIFWLLLLFVIANSIKKKITNDSVKAYFNRALVFKFFMSLVFAFTYILYFKGGDTTAYWEGAVSLNKLMINNPAHFIENLFSEPTFELYSKHFNNETGFPPGWIYRESEAWFVCKITSFISIITFRSYLAGTIIFAFAITISSIKLFDKISKLNIHSNRMLAFAFLFMPSVAFWCSGVSKDSITYWSVLQIILFFMSYFVFKERPSILQLIYLFLAFFLLYHTRIFVLAATVAPILMAYGTRITKRFEKSSFSKYSIRILIFGTGFSFFFIFLGSGFATDLFKEAQVIQDDFKNNESYTGKRYEINTTDVSPTGLLKAMPLSVFYGIYKPFPYEAFSLTLLLNGIESLILFYFTIMFISKGLNNIKIIFNSEFLVFSLLFVFFIGFMAGFSSVLIGVLVRIRAPLLPFYILILTANEINSIKKESVTTPN